MNYLIKLIGPYQQMVVKLPTESQQMHNLQIVVLGATSDLSKIRGLQIYGYYPVMCSSRKCLEATPPPSHTPSEINRPEVFTDP